MTFETFKHFLNSTLLNTVAVAVVGGFAYWIGRMQARMQDSVELYATFGVMQDINNEDIKIPIIHIQNVGSRIIYFDAYDFNGSRYELNGHVRPSTYSNALNNFYRISLPTNGNSHVSVFIFFHDIEMRKWKSQVVCDLSNGWWDVKTFPRERVK